MYFLPCAIFLMATSRLMCVLNGTARYMVAYSIHLVFVQLA